VFYDGDRVLGGGWIRREDAAAGASAALLDSAGREGYVHAARRP
jgi:hypothetical protein